MTIGEEAVFGQYSSANGQIYPNGYTDIASGDSFSRTGVQAPLAGSGDGGAGGRGGVKGNQHTVSYTDSEGETHFETVIDNYPGEGTAGAAGALGCVVVYWDTPED